LASKKVINEDLNSIVQSCLEATRVEAARRLRLAGYPLSIQVPCPYVIDGPNNSRQFRTIYERRSGLAGEYVGYAIADQSVSHRLLGFRPQLEPLAEYLLSNTAIAEQRYGELLGNDKIDGLLFRCLSPLAEHYLMSLTDIAKPRPALLKRLSGELLEVATSNTVRQIYQLELSGISTNTRITHRDVSIRPLTPRERGAWSVANGGFDASEPIRDSDYLPAAPFLHAFPSALLELTSTRSKLIEPDRSCLPSKVSLAFFLLGFDIGSFGLISHFGQPSWSSMGRHTTHFPVAERTGIAGRTITKAQFRQVVDLAHQIPNFSRAETNSKEIVLWRVLQGCGGRSSRPTFIDFAIALEAALLGQGGGELSFRFSLYGALFLQPEYDPAETFQRLKRIYATRSRLFHGSAVDARQLHQTSLDAAELAKAVTLKSITTAWPSTDALNALAIVSAHR
jgi:Apea-like HEPN